MRCREKKKRRRRRKDGEWHILSLFFFNKGFLYPRDTYLCDHRSEEEEEQRAEEVVG